MLKVLVYYMITENLFFFLTYFAKLQFFLKRCCIEKFPILVKFSCTGRRTTSFRKKPTVILNRAQVSLLRSSMQTPDFSAFCTCLSSDIFWNVFILILTTSHVYNYFTHMSDCFHYVVCSSIPVFKLLTSSIPSTFIFFINIYKLTILSSNHLLFAILQIIKIQRNEWEVDA